MLTSAIDIHHGGSGDYSFVEGAAPTGDPLWVHARRQVFSAYPRDFAHELGTRDEPTDLDRVVFTAHHPIRPAYTPSAIRPVVTVREPYAQILSLAQHRAFAATDLRPFATKGVERVAHFFNFWGDWVSGVTDGRALVIRYEEIIDDPLGCLVAIARHWELGLSPAVLELAVERNDRARMSAKVDHAANKRITVQPRLQADETDRAEIQARLRATVEHTFGYVL